MENLVNALGFQPGFIASFLILGPPETGFFCVQECFPRTVDCPARLIRLALRDGLEGQCRELDDSEYTDADTSMVSH